eukprot:6286554-Alexandrium_andersonii.AAC.1
MSDCQVLVPHCSTLVGFGLWARSSRWQPAPASQAGRQGVVRRPQMFATEAIGSDQTRASQAWGSRNGSSPPRSL